MKKLLIALAILFAFPANAQVPEGAIVKTVNNPDVYIVKYNAGGQYKRLVLNPLVFQSYGHLKWENLLTISQSEMDSFDTSSLVKVDGSSDVYELTPTGDNGTKQRLTSTWGINLDSVYIINAVDFSNYADNGTKYVMSKEDAIALDVSEEAQRKADEEAKAKADADAAAKVAEDEKNEANTVAINKITEIVKGYNSRLSFLQSQIDANIQEGNDLDTQYADVINKSATYLNSIYATPEYYAWLKKSNEYISKMKVITGEYSLIKADYDTVLEKKNKIAAIYYEITDYLNHGVIIPAADRAYLLSLGIDFQC